MPRKTWVWVWVTPKDLSTLGTHTPGDLAQKVHSPPEDDLMPFETFQQLLDTKTPLPPHSLAVPLSCLPLSCLPSASASGPDHVLGRCWFLYVSWSFSPASATSYIEHLKIRWLSNFHLIKSLLLSLLLHTCQQILLTCVQVRRQC